MSTHSPTEDLQRIFSVRKQNKTIHGHYIRRMFSSRNNLLVINIERKINLAHFFLPKKIH